MGSVKASQLFRSYRFVDHATQVYAVVVGFLLLVFHNQTVPRWRALVGLHILLIVLLHGLIQAGSRPAPAKILDFLRNYYPVLLYTAFFCEAGWINRMFFTDYLDASVIRAEQAIFGCQPSTALMAKLPYLLVSELFYLSYFSYYLMISGVGLALFIRNRAQFLHFISVVSFVFYVCYIIYVFVPVIGPRVLKYDFEGFNLPVDLANVLPVEPYPEVVTRGVFFKIMGWIYRTFEAPGSALPSSHVAVALCTLFFSFLYLPKIKYLHLVMAILLCLSTVYCGYHYAIDVVAGVITAGILVPLGNGLYRRFGNPNEHGVRQVTPS
jgi:membrane-associated phospholipid phosphatase